MRTFAGDGCGRWEGRAGEGGGGGGGGRQEVGGMCIFCLGKCVRDRACVS